MAQLMLVNPSPRKSKRKTKPKKRKVKVMAKKKAKRSAKQRAWSKKLGRMSKARSRPARKRKRNPSAPAKRARTRTVTKNVTRYRNRPVKRRAVRRRNPSARGVINQLVMPAAMQAGGAIALDVVMGYGQGYLPVQLSTGPGKALVKGVAAIAIGMVAGKLGKRKLGNDMARGALTVTLHDLFRSTLEQNAPQIPLGDMDSGDMDMLGMSIHDQWGGNPMGAYLPAGAQPQGVAPQVDASGMGAYVSGYDDTSY